MPIANLLINADKFTAADLPISLVVRRGAVVVSDRGPGISVADRDRVFDRFYRSACDPVDAWIRFGIGHREEDRRSAPRPGSLRAKLRAVELGWVLNFRCRHRAGWLPRRRTVFEAHGSWTRTLTHEGWWEIRIFSEPFAFTGFCSLDMTQIMTP